MTETRRTSPEEARRVGDAIGVDWNRFDLDEFRMGMDVEFEHRSHDPVTSKDAAPSSRVSRQIPVSALIRPSATASVSVL